MRRGEQRRFLVGVGHGTCTCEGAAFEYVVNLEFELRARKVRDRAEITWITNEYELGDFGMGGMHLKRGGLRHAQQRLQRLALRRARDRLDHPRARAARSSQTASSTRPLDGASRRAGASTSPCCCRRSPASALKAFDRDGADISERLFLPNGFMRVDADYTREALRGVEGRRLAAHLPVARVPATSSRPGSRSRPPHAISRPHATPNGTPIAPAPPRTGMPSAMIAQGRRAQHRRHDPRRRRARPHTASMAEMGAACVASAGANPFTGTAASMTVFPIVPDYERYPEHGRDLDRTFGEIGLAGHWIKILLHHLFLYKARTAPRLAARSRSKPMPTSDRDDEKLRYVTTPTRRTVFMRTFLPWQLWRFAVINLKMVGHHPSAATAHSTASSRQRFAAAHHGSRAVRTVSVSQPARQFVQGAGTDIVVCAVAAHMCGQLLARRPAVYA